MRLVHKETNIEVQKDEVLTSFRGTQATAVFWRKQTHGEGKITVKEDNCLVEYYVSVFGLEWVD